MTMLPEVAEVILRLSSMATPPPSSVESVRVTREMATLVRRLPKMGILRTKRSTVIRPKGVLR